MKKILAITFSISMAMSVVFVSHNSVAAAGVSSPQVGYIKRKSRKVYYRTKNGVRYVGHKTANGTRWTVVKTKRGTKKAYRKTKTTTKKTYSKTKDKVTN
jgi:hypothetical protein